MEQNDPTQRSGGIAKVFPHTIIRTPRVTLRARHSVQNFQDLEQQQQDGSTSDYPSAKYKPKSPPNTGPAPDLASDPTVLWNHHQSTTNPNNPNYPWMSMAYESVAYASANSSSDKLSRMTLFVRKNATAVAACLSFAMLVLFMTANDDAVASSKSGLRV